MIRYRTLAVTALFACASALAQSELMIYPNNDQDEEQQE